MSNPFDEQFVLRVTVNNMKKSVDFSINRTFARVEEFSDDPIKSTEIFNTLAKLHVIRKQLDNFYK